MNLRFGDRGRRPAGSRADAIGDAGWYLIKNVHVLRLTGQIRLLSIGAGEAGQPLIIVVQPTTRLSSDLERFIKDYPHVRLERTIGA